MSPTVWGLSHSSKLSPWRIHVDASLAGDMFGVVSMSRKCYLGWGGIGGVCGEGRRGRGSDVWIQASKVDENWRGSSWWQRGHHWSMKGTFALQLSCLVSIFFIWSCICSALYLLLLFNTLEEFISFCLGLFFWEGSQHTHLLWGDMVDILSGQWDSSPFQVGYFTHPLEYCSMLDG